MSDSQEIPYHNQLKIAFVAISPSLLMLKLQVLMQKRCVTRTSRHHIKMDENGYLHPDQKCHFHIKPFEGANINPESFEI